MLLITKKVMVKAARAKWRLCSPTLHLQQVVISWVDLRRSSEGLFFSIRTQFTHFSAHSKFTVLVLEIAGHDFQTFVTHKVKSWPKFCSMEL